MPSAAPKKSKPGAYPSLDDEADSVLADQDAVPRTAKKKVRNATTKQVDVADEGAAEEVARDRSASPARPQSILGQIPHAFGRHNYTQDALDTFGTTQKVSDHYSLRADDWAQDAPFGRSPSSQPASGINTSESPPVGPGHVGRGGFSTKSPPVSPRQRQARPVSYGGVAGQIPIRQPLHEPAFRYPPSIYGSPPALPHLPQPHFYAAADVDLGLARGFAPVATPDATFIGFSQLPYPENHVKDSEDTIFLGSEGSLNILTNQLMKCEPIGALHGLPGTVVSAAFLTWESGIDPFADSRPLVAIISHGPLLSDEDDGSGDSSEDDFTLTAVTAEVPTSNQTFHTGVDFQTRVDVYSLARQTHVANLLKLPPASAEPSFRGEALQPPAPQGSLNLEARGNFLTISSGSSGEVYVFGVLDEGKVPAFECLTKVWTSIQPQQQRRDSSHGRSPDDATSPADLDRRISPIESPIASLSSRWLAICPASSPSRPTIGASFGRAVVQRRLRGLDTHSAPSRPTVSCEADSPDADTILSKAVRGVAQGVVRGARFLADQGLQSWNNYWKKDQSTGGLSPFTYNMSLHPAQQLPVNFPPTHSLETQTNAQEPDIISIFDLKAIQRSPGKKILEAPKPVSTFQPPGGCSFLSFMPNGLGILTASRKGDIQYIWDLLQLKHGRNAAASVNLVSQDASTSVPSIRQIFKISRLTSSSIVDVAWESAVGDRFALVTRNGTVHLFDIPASAFRWPPPRGLRKTRATSAPVDANVVMPADPPPPGGFFAQAMSIAGKTPPMLANLRGRAPSIGFGLTGIGSSGIGLASATGVKSSRAVAAGLSKSLGAATGTVNQMRHAGETRLHLRSMANDPSTGKIAWSFRGPKPVLCVLDKTAVRSYAVSRQTRVGNRPARGSIFEGRKPSATRLPQLSSLVPKTGIGMNATTSNQFDYATQKLQIWWEPRYSPQMAAPRAVSHPLSHAEIDSNAPYQPFHSDPRVNLLVYSDDTELSESNLPTASAVFNPCPVEHISGPAEEWVFGNHIPALKLNIRHANRDDNSLSGGVESIMYRETVSSPSADTDADGPAESIICTTRRRKNKKLDASQMQAVQELGPEGFFEDDCDVLDFAGDRV